MCIFLQLIFRVGLNKGFNLNEFLPALKLISWDYSTVQNLLIQIISVQGMASFVLQFIQRSNKQILNFFCSFLTHHKHKNWNSNQKDNKLIPGSRSLSQIISGSVNSFYYELPPSTIESQLSCLGIYHQWEYPLGWQMAAKIFYAIIKSDGDF